jgi:large subunit ribosomal protein L1
VADDDETIACIQSGWTDFDAIATPDMMGVGRLAVSWPVRLAYPVPAPRACHGYSAGDRDRKQGGSNSPDKTANLHVPIGKASFDVALKNLAAPWRQSRKQPISGQGSLSRRNRYQHHGAGIHIDPMQAIMEASE